MSDYTKVNDFSSKDALPAGDPAKKVSGQLFQDEFDAIQEALNSKANKEDIADPAPPVFPKFTVIEDTDRRLTTFNIGGDSGFTPFVSMDFNTSEFTSKFKMTLQTKAQRGRSFNTSNGDVARVEGLFKITNNQTGSEFIYPSDTSKPFSYEFSINVEGDTSSSNSRTINLVWTYITPDSIRNLVGDSSIGYNLEVLIALTQEGNFNTTSTATVGRNTLLMAEELPQ